jgi:pyruvate dehydrogenase E1 component alpha subunit
MMTIRAFEAALLKREDRGFQLMSSGQEAVSVGLCAALEDGDQLLTSGRSIGPALARGIEPGRVMAELLGKVTGPNRGKAGRGHIADPSKGFMGAHAVVGGNLTIAAGVALAALSQGRPIAVACMFGDGACGSGALHETLNIAALWRLPLLFVCDNNQYSVSTPQREALAATPLSSLAEPFGIPARTIDGMDVMAVKDAAAALLDHVRAASGPAFLECVSVRFMPHSTLTRETRSAAEVSAGKARCPIARLSASLKESGALSDDQFAVIEAEVASSIAQALRFADESPYPDSDEARTDVA